jgi:hypothetical protein
MISPYRALNVIFVLIGVAGLLLRSWFSESIPDFAFSYLGNVSVSFAVYFIVRLAVRDKLNMILSALLAIFIVEVFEATNGFGIMTNVYDHIDYVANAIGVALAFVVDVFSSKMFRIYLKTSE